MLRLASTDSNVYYAHVRDAATSTTPRAVCEFKKKIYARNFAILRLASTDTNVYYAHVRDPAADLQPPRRHEQEVSSKKIYALYCNANLSVATNESVSLFDMCRR